MPRRLKRRASQGKRYPYPHRSFQPCNITTAGRCRQCRPQRDIRPLTRLFSAASVATGDGNWKFFPPVNDIAAAGALSPKKSGDPINCRACSRWGSAPVARGRRAAAARITQRSINLQTNSFISENLFPKSWPNPLSGDTRPRVLLFPSIASFRIVSSTCPMYKTSYCFTLKTSSSRSKPKPGRRTASSAGLSPPPMTINKFSMSNSQFRPNRGARPFPPAAPCIAHYAFCILH